MKEPRRLLDTPGTPAVLRADLKRVAKHSVSYDAALGLAALKQTLGDMPGADPAETVAAASGTGAVTGAALPAMLKLALVAAVGGGVALAVGWFASDGALEPVPAPVAFAPRTPAPVAPAPMAPAPVAPAPMAPTPVVTREPPPPAATEADPNPVRQPNASRREIAQLVRIRALLERDPAAAHRAIQAANREFPSGVLREERDGLDAIALFRAGKSSEGRARAERYIERYPRSPLRERLERLLARESP